MGELILLIWFLPDWQEFANPISENNRGKLLPDTNDNMDMNVLSKYFAEIVKLNPTRFRLFGPDETMSNRFWEMFKVTNRQWMQVIKNPNDEFISPEVALLILNYQNTKQKVGLKVIL